MPRLRKNGNKRERLKSIKTSRGSAKKLISVKGLLKAAKKAHPSVCETAKQPKEDFVEVPQ